MSDVKRLLEEARSRPWTWLFDTYEPATVFITNAPTAEQEPIVEQIEAADAALIVYAVNALPDYEELRETVGAMWDSIENDIGDPSLEKDMEWERRWSQVSAVLARLRESVAV